MTEAELNPERTKRIANAVAAQFRLCLEVQRLDKLVAVTNGPARIVAMHKRAAAEAAAPRWARKWLVSLPPEDSK